MFTLKTLDVDILSLYIKDAKRREDMPNIEFM